MLHLLPESRPEPRPLAYAEAVSRLASIRHALRLLDPFGAGPASDPSDGEAIAAAWDDAGEGRQRWFDRRSARTVGAAVAGLEALLKEQKGGHRPHAEASRLLVEDIRRELRDVAGIVLG